MTHARPNTAGLLIGTAVLAACLVPAVAEAKRELTPLAAAAVKAAFPQATIRNVGVERESGVNLFEVTLALGKRRIELEVSANGILVEIEERVRLENLAENMAESIRKATEGGRIRRIERHEWRGRIRDGKVTPRESVKIVYEVRYTINGRRRRFLLRFEGSVTLPPEAAAAVKAAFPKAEITKVGRETEDGLDLFEVELKEGEREFELEVTAEGVIVEIEEEIAPKDVPEAVMNAIKKAAEGATLTETERHEYRAEVREGKLVKLTVPKITYEAELQKGKLSAEIEVAADGTVVKPPQWKEGGENGDDEDDDDEDDDDEEEDDD